MLPKIKHPLFEVTVPSTKQKIKIRPFTVKEEKMLVMGKDFKERELADLVKQILRNCIVTKVDLEKLAFFDIEYLFIKLRAKSVNEIIELTYNLDDKEQINFDVNLEEMSVKFNEKNKNVIPVKDTNILIKMKYPSFEDIFILDFKEFISEEEKIDTYLNCIDSIYEGEKEFSNFTKEELANWILELPSSVLDEIDEFFETLPALEHQVEVKKKDGEKIKISLRGLKSFFTY